MRRSPLPPAGGRLGVSLPQATIILVLFVGTRSFKIYIYIYGKDDHGLIMGKEVKLVGYE